MLIQRALYQKILQRLAPGKAVILLGPRQAGKSTILEEIGGKAPKNTPIGLRRQRRAYASGNPAIAQLAKLGWRRRVAFLLTKPNG